MTNQSDTPEHRLGSIRRLLNLDLVEDRRELVTIFASQPTLAVLADENIIDNYLKWFRAPEWHMIYSGGMVAGPEPRGQNTRHGSSIDSLLAATVKLGWLEDYAGFGTLISGLDNPSQISSAIFEIDAAAWCATRQHTKGLTFSPEIVRSAGIKHPDFLWETTLGDLYCECKQLNTWQRTESQRIAALASAAFEVMGDPELWPNEVRIEILIYGRFKAGAKDRLKAIVRQQSAEARLGIIPDQFQDDTFTVAVRNRSDEPFTLADSMTVRIMQVGSVPVPLHDPGSAHLIVTRSMGFARVRALRDFVKEAKQQLPEGGPGGIFIELPSGVDIAAQKLEEMLGQPAHHAVVWASIWTGGNAARVVWRNGQPRDARLIEPMQDVAQN